MDWCLIPPKMICYWGMVDPMALRTLNGIRNQFSEFLMEWMMLNEYLHGIGNDFLLNSKNYWCWPWYTISCKCSPLSGGASKPGKCRFCPLVPLVVSEVILVLRAGKCVGTEAWWKKWQDAKCVIYRWCTRHTIHNQISPFRSGALWNNNCP